MSAQREQSRGVTRVRRGPGRKPLPGGQALTRKGFLLDSESLGHVEMVQRGTRSTSESAGARYALREVARQMQLVASGAKIVAHLPDGVQLQLDIPSAA